LKIVAAKKTALDDAVDLALELLNAEDTVKTMDDRLKYADKFGKLTRTILKIGKSKELLSYNDINDFYASTLGRKHSAGELSREKAIEAFNVFLKDVVDWSCYLSLSGILGLPKGYVLGECAVVNFDDLPKSLKEEIADSWKHKFELNKGRLHGESFDSFQKREEKETYLGCTVSTIGFDKALETARRIGTQAISIYKIVYEWELPQIREIWASSKKLSGGTPEESVGQVSFPHFPTPNLEHYIEVLTKMVRAKTKCDIERNLILATEMRGLVQREMPNELKFLLAMMSMEAALSGGSGPIAWKLRERIALLLGDDPNWVHIYLKKGLTETVSAG